MLTLAAHVLVSGSALWLIGTSPLPLSVRIVGGAVVAAVLLPWLQTIAARRLDRFAWLGLLLVLVIGIGIVEVLATEAQLAATLLLGAAMFEFALLLIVTRGVTRKRPQPASNEPEQS